ncbi:MAG: RteC domain-containing protein [Bacteroidaceae bacterium]|nr:RteC domain-containing protein [Bacteroidaceae bacterium]
MNHTILTNTEFFQRITGNECQGLSSAYNSFVAKVIEHCHTDADMKHIAIALMYAEIELQFHQVSDDGEMSVYIRKALAFVKKMQRHLSAVATQVPPLNPSNHKPESAYRWTGSFVELVEIIYALDEMRCINDGENAINELTTFFGNLFGLEIKDNICYNAYADMKRRKNDSRTYFLDKLSQRLNLRMQRDDERERMRR